MIKELNITKSDFLDYENCKKNFWLKKNKPELFEEINLSEFELKIIEEGNFVDKEIKHIFPDGIIVDIGENSLRETIEEINNFSTILQGSIECKDFFIRFDVLQYNKHKDSWDLFEVKSSSSVKEENISDITFQKIVAENSGIKINRLFIVHLNKNYKNEGSIDYDKLFVKSEVSSQVKSIEDSIRVKMNEIKNYLNSPEEKGCDCIYKSRSKHCSSFSYSNPNIKDNSIYELNRISKKTIFDLIEKKELSLDNISDLSSLSKYQSLQLESYKSKSPIYNLNEIKEELNNLSFPLQFFDFETFSNAIPRFENMGSNDAVPIQFSNHILNIDGSLDHREFIQDKYSKNITISLVESIVNNVFDQGTIICWYKPFEKRMLKRLIELHPEHSNFLENITNRIYDLMDIFSKGIYVDYKFQGSSSLKNVLPVLVPSLSYKNMDIQDGAQAASEWERMIFENSVDSENIKQNLLKYCSQDTLAMVEIYKFLRNL